MRSRFRPEFGDWLRQRKGEDTTRVEFAGSIGISAPYLDSLLKGVVPPLRRVIAMATSIGDNPLDWLRAAGYEEGEPVAPEAYDAEPGDIVVACLDDQRYIKRYVGRENGSVMLASDNPEYPPTPPGPYEILAVYAWQHRPKAAKRRAGR